MNTRELFELASLDVLGLLDEQEREAFEQGFKAAPPSVQAQIRREQLRFSEMEKMLPEVEAPTGLRARVIAAVRDAIAAVGSEPIARIGTSSVSHPVFNSAPLWRAACIGFATAALVLAGFGYKVMGENNLIQDQLASSGTASGFQAMALRAGGIDPARLLASDFCQRVSFSPTAPDAAGPNGRIDAYLLIDTQSRKAILACEGLTIGDNTYTLIIESGSGSQLLESFKPDAHSFYVPLRDLDPAQLDKLQIRGPGAPGAGGSTVLLRSDAV